MTKKVRIPFDAAAVVVPTPEAGHSMNSVVYAGPVDGTATAGVITVRCKAPASTNFESPKDSAGVVTNTIDIAAPEKLNIPGEIVDYEFTIAGFVGTATLVNMGIASYE